MRLRVSPRYRIEDFDDWLSVVCEPSVRERNVQYLRFWFNYAQRALIRRRLNNMRYCRFHPRWRMLFKRT